MNTPVVPHKDFDFDRVSGLAVENATQYATKWDIPSPEITLLTDSHTAWHAAYEKAIDPSTRTNGVIAAKDTARVKHEGLLRKFLKRWIMTNDLVSDQDHVNMGLPVYKKTHSRVPPPDDVPEPEGKATTIDGRVSLSWRGRKSGSKANPYCQKVVVRHTVLPLDAPVPTHIEQLEHTLLDGRQPCKISHPEKDWGKVMYFATAYQNTRGEMGDWSPIRSVIIPGRKI
jgi:hypothetical protein